MGCSEPWDWRTSRVSLLPFLVHLHSKVLSFSLSQSIECLSWVVLCNRGLLSFICWGPWRVPGVYLLYICFEAMHIFYYVPNCWEVYISIPTCEASWHAGHQGLLQLQGWEFLYNMCMLILFLFIIQRPPRTVNIGSQYGRLIFFSYYTLEFRLSTHAKVASQNMISVL